jgi:hypothetical protein
MTSLEVSHVVWGVVEETPVRRTLSDVNGSRKLTP